MEDQANNYRREDKYISELFNYNEIKNKIIGLGFKKAHSSNYINNIYYDNDNKSYLENVEGETYRTKYRLRWYDSRKDYIFEIKNKHGKSGNKIRHNFEASNKKEIEKEINEMLPNNYKEVIKNRYFREYFIKEKTRITIDSRIRFCDLKSNNYKFFEKIIIEIKYPIDEIYDLEILKQLNLKLSKFSKFAKGLEYLKRYNFKKKYK